MTKQKQIEEIAQFICGRSTDGICIIDRTSCDRRCAWARTAEAIYNAGYRKSGEVRKETAKDIVYRFRKYDSYFDDYKFDRILDDIEIDYGIEVEE